MRKLSEVVKRLNNPIKAEELEGQEFVLVSGWRMATRFGPRVVFEVDLGHDENYSLMLAEDGYRLAILDALQESPIGPVTITRKPTQQGNDYWMIEDVVPETSE